MGSVRLTSDNKALAACVRHWCSARGVTFYWDIQPSNETSSSLLLRVYRGLPARLKALIQFSRHIWSHWPLRGAGLDEWEKSKGDITFFSYLSNLENDVGQKGGFSSNFWGRLPDELSKNHCKTNWLHIFVSDSSHPTAKHGKIKIERFNQMGRGSQVHTALEAFLSWSIAYNTLKDWFSILKFVKVLEPTISSVDSEGVHLWPLYKEEWRSSLRGAPAIMTILNLNLFEAAVGVLPRQRIGVYLYEQQAWEIALIHSWKTEGHGVLVGAQHSTMLDWDMRYFHDPRNYERSNHNDLPMPHMVATNGQAIMEKSLKAGYPKDNLIGVEALRYLYLDILTKGKTTCEFTTTGVPRLLVLGDYLESNTKNQMDLLVRTLVSFPLDIVITVKPHPASMIDASDYPEIDIKVTMAPLGDLLEDCDLAYSSSVTSAAVDAYCFDVPVITALDSNALNLSPLRNCDGVYFVSTSEELSEALCSITSRNFGSYEKKDFFTLDSELPRWKKLLLETNT